MDTLELSFPASTRYVRIAAQFAAHTGALFCRDIAESEVVDKFLSVLELVVSEACTNAVQHSSVSGEKGVIMQVSLDEEQIIIKVKDFNKPFDFDGIKEPDLNSHPENGYGIFLMRSFMDEMKYTHELGWNCITLVKKKPVFEGKKEMRE